MRPYVRKVASAVAMAAIIASLAGGPAIAAAPPTVSHAGVAVPLTVLNSYTSTAQFETPFMGLFRTYNGTSIHIQLNTSASTSGTYQISVYRLDCIGTYCYDTLVGSAGNCPYNGFCGYGWSINLQGNDYAFYFWKNDDGVTVTSNNVQMWSTD